MIIEHALCDNDLNDFDGIAARWMPRAGGCDVSGEDKAWLSQHPALGAVASSLSLEPMMLLRVVSFEKSAAANWFVPWHQDRSRPLPDHDAAWARGSSGSALHGDGGSKVRNQVEFTAEVLARMVSLRVHLDDCGEDDGPLEAVLGSHQFGALRREAVGLKVKDSPTGLCLAQRGDIVAMSPLLVHRSQRARAPSAMCRVLHLEYMPNACLEAVEWTIRPERFPGRGGGEETAL